MSVFKERRGKVARPTEQVLRLVQIAAIALQVDMQTTERLVRLKARDSCEDIVQVFKDVYQNTASTLQTLCFLKTIEAPAHKHQIRHDSITAMVFNPSNIKHVWISETFYSESIYLTEGLCRRYHTDNEARA